MTSGLKYKSSNINISIFLKLPMLLAMENVEHLLIVKIV